MFGLIIAIFLPFVAAFLIPLLRGKWEERAGWFALPVPFASLALIWHTVGAHEGYNLEAPSVVRVAWMTEFGLDLSFRIDGLSIFFASVVAGVGALIVLYGLGYFGGHGKRMGRFFAYLCLFMGAMLGTVLSNNLLLLFIFWELTGLASFLLIGFQHDEKAESSRGARMALVTTAAGGIALLAGVVLLRHIYGSFELDEILRATTAPGSEGLLLGAFLLCMLGCFSKSAIFPFHYWLPNAMAAPTPVSAYLHSATMVKLGVFLVARLVPVFSELEAWMPVLTVFGFGTMLLGAGFAVFSHDLKGVLAYSTVAQLGLLIGFYGMHSIGEGGLGRLEWDYIHILNHSLYKAGLFMVVGIIDHSTGTRDLRKLGGLFRLMPLTGIAAFLGLASMAGLPFTSGFLSKELLLKSALYFTESGTGALFFWPIVAVVLASVLKVVFSIGIFHRAFLGRPTHAVEEHWHAPSVWVQLPPLFLGLSALTLGIASGTFSQINAFFAVPKQHVADFATLSVIGMLTHISAPLLFSIGIVIAGAVIYVVCTRIGWERFGISKPLLFENYFNSGIDGLPYAGKKLTYLIGAGKPSWYIPITLIVLVSFMALLLLRVDREFFAALSLSMDPLPAARAGWMRWVLVAVAFVAVGTLLRTSTILGQLLALSIVGIVVAVYFVLYHAPDLALTQILVESASLLLIVLIVFRLRRGGVSIEGGKGPWQWRAVVGVLAGVVAGFMVILFQSGPDAKIGAYFVKHTNELAWGANAVNTVLVDFRGFDTLLEIVVLLIATLGGLGLLMRRRADQSATGLHQRRRAEDLFPVPNNFVLRSAGMVLFIVLNVLSVYFFFRGHNNPGGGFIAGLVCGLSLLLVGFIRGVDRSRALVPMNGVVLAAIGVGISIVSGLLGPLAGLPWMYQFHTYLGPIYVGTPLLFDLGVFLTVVGVVLKLVFPLMKSVHGLPAFVAEEEHRYSSIEDEPIDISHGNRPSGSRRKEGGFQ
jgi:NADH:ubiquinone oxidoreductase subunit 5 (subunit L)/multisubunit Na+/H+ antiporter MnhA subunit